MKNIFRYRNAIFFSLILLIGIILRFYLLGALPTSLNVDEAALGYNSYSILKTGADEHGKFLPLALESFGDWKLPVYSYLDVVPLALFGISEFSIRLPSFVAGIFSIIFIYVIALILFKNKSVALASSFFIAVNPWSVFFSRGAYEVNVATTIFLGALLTFLYFHKKKSLPILFSSFFLFGLTMFTQHNYILFSPLFVIYLLVLKRKSYALNRGFYIAVIFFIFIVISSVVSVSSGGGKKASNLSVFNDRNVIYNRAEKLRGDNSQKFELGEKLLYNKYYAGAYQFTLNYFSAYSANVLFDKGGDRLTHNVGDIGYFYLVDAFLLAFGLFFLAWHKQKKQLMILIPWLLLAPIPSAITHEHTGTRLFTIVPPMVIIAGYGAYSIIMSLKNTKVRVITTLFMSTIYLLSVLYFINYYFVHFNVQRARFWQYGNKQVVQIANYYGDKKIVMRGPENFPYIYFLLYNSYDPEKFRREVTYYPTTPEGFKYVREFGRYKFVSKIQNEKETSDTLYIDDQNFGLKDAFVRLPNGDPVFKYYVGVNMNMRK